MNERLFQAREVLEKQVEELNASLSNKMKESLRIEESLREQLLHRGKRVKDAGFDGLLKAFDLYDEQVPMASKETQTDNSNMLGFNGMPQVQMISTNAGAQG